MRIKLVYTFLCAFLLLGCRKNNTTWNSDWNLLLVNDDLSLDQAVEDSLVAINPDQSVQVIANKSLINLDISSLIEIPDTTVNQTLALSVSSLSVSPGVTFIDEIKEHDFNIDDVGLVEARVIAGTANIKLYNPIDTKGVFKIELPGVYKNGIVFSVSKNVSAGSNFNPGVAEFTIDLSGYTIDMSGENGDSYNLLQSKMTVSTDADGEAVTVTDQDGFKTEISFSNLNVDYAKGYFGSMEFSDTSEVTIDQLQNIVGGNVNLEDITLDLILRNGIVVPATGKITLFESINYNNDVVSLSHPQFNQQLNIDPAQGSWNSLVPSKRLISFDNSTGNMTSFLENIGSRYKIGYSIQINPLGNISNGNNYYYPESDLGVDIVANFPLTIGMDNLAIQDTFDIDFKNDNNVLRVQEGKLVLKTTNTFPIGASVTLRLLDENQHVIQLISSSGQITPAQTNSNNDGHLPVEDELEFVINKAAADALANTKSILIHATFNTTQYTNNILYSNAAIQFKLFSHLKLDASL